MRKFNTPPASVAEQYVTDWSARARIIEQALDDYLVGMTDEENRLAVQRIFAHVHAPEARPSGLLEQQRWFATFRLPRN